MNNEPQCYVQYISEQLAGRGAKSGMVQYWENIASNYQAHRLGLNLPTHLARVHLALTCLAYPISDDPNRSRYIGEIEPRPNWSNHIRDSIVPLMLELNILPGV